MKRRVRFIGGPLDRQARQVASRYADVPTSKGTFRYDCRAVQVTPGLTLWFGVPA